MSYAEEHKRGGRWDTWSGTVADLIEAAKLAAQLASRREGRSPIEYSVIVRLATRELELVNEDDLATALTDAELPLVENVEIVAKDVDDGGERTVVLMFRREAPAVVVAALGGQRTWVDDAFARMERLLGQGGRRQSKGRSRGLWYALGGVLVSAVGVVLSFTLPDSAWRTAIGVGLAAVGLGLTFVGFFHVWLGGLLEPPLQLVPEGGLSRHQRARAALRATGGKLATALLSAATVALVTVVVERLLSG